MRYGIISDVHANLPALEVVLQRLDRDGHDHLLCLGDTVGYGAFPNECCDLIRQRAPVVVRGNHDEAAVIEGAEEWFTPAACTCILWTRGELTPDNQAFLSELKPYAQVEGAELCHGSLLDPDFYTTTSQEATVSFRQMVDPLCFFGHTHYAEWFAQGPDAGLPRQVSATAGGSLTLEPGYRYLFNPGAVGQPRDGDSRASYAIWDTEAGTVQILRAPYNIAASQVAMREARLPKSMWERLTLGI